jgi:hypothetical protein
MHAPILLEQARDTRHDSTSAQQYDCADLSYWI